MRHLLLAGVLFMGLSGLAQAADLTYPMAGTGPMVAPTASFNWAGPYVGINGGFGSGSVDWAYAPPPGTANHSTSGGLLGVTLGTNLLNGPWLYGLEGDVDWANIDGSTACPYAAFSCHSNLNWLGTLRGRIGWTTNNILLYGTGGLAVGGVNIATTQLAGAPTPTSGTPTNGSNSTDLGWTAGLGAEFGFNNTWSVKAEWLYYDLGTHAHTVDNSLKVNARETGSVFKVGLNKHF